MSSPRGMPLGGKNIRAISYVHVCTQFGLVGIRCLFLLFFVCVCCLFVCLFVLFGLKFVLFDFEWFILFCVVLFCLYWFVLSYTRLKSIKDHLSR